MTPSRITRRGALSVAVAAYAAHATGAAASDAAPKTDPELLRELVAVEQLLIVVYGRVIDTGLLSPRVLRVARRVLGQERVHAAVVGRALTGAGGVAPRPMHTSDAIDKALATLKVSGSVTKLRSEHDCVHMLLEVEMAAQGVYYQAISELRSLALAQLAVRILASEAAHQTAVSEARRPGDASQSVPTSFVKGTS